MSKSTAVDCPECGRTNHIGANYSNNTVLGSRGGGAFETQCAHCGATIRIGTQDGVYSTVGGRLQRVAAANEATRLILSARPTPLELQQLQTVIAAGIAAGKGPAQITADIKGFAAFKAWCSANPALVAGLFQLICTILMILGPRLLPPAQPQPAPPTVVNVTTPAPSQEDMTELIRLAVEEAMRSQPPAADPPTTPPPAPPALLPSSTEPEAPEAPEAPAVS